MNLNYVNKEFYNTYADYFDKIPFEEFLPHLFFKYVSKTNSHILEIGSGAGALAVWMTNLGHSVRCIEPAEKPAEIARKKGLQVHEITFQEYQSQHQFDYIVAISSLIHLPRSEIASQMKKVSELLKQEGVFFVSFIEGTGEGYEDPTNKGKMRYFSKFSDVELKKIAELYFSIIEVHKIEVKKMKQLFTLFVLKQKNGN